MGKDNIISDNIALGFVILIAVIFGYIWKSFDFFGFWSFIVFTIIIIILYILFV